VAAGAEVSVGSAVELGASVGVSLGAVVTVAVGSSVAVADGSGLGVAEGSVVGVTEGITEGVAEGFGLAVAKGSVVTVGLVTTVGKSVFSGWITAAVVRVAAAARDVRVVSGGTAADDVPRSESRIMRAPATSATVSTAAAIHPTILRGTGRIPVASAATSASFPGSTASLAALVAAATMPTGFSTRWPSAIASASGWAAVTPVGTAVAVSASTGPCR
jgi:hypothetical protein